MRKYPVAIAPGDWNVNDYAFVHSGDEDIDAVRVWKIQTTANENPWAYSIGYTSNLPVGQQGFREIAVTAKDPRLRVVQSRTGYVAHPQN